MAKVWVDICTSYKTLMSWDLLLNESLHVFGIDALHKNVYNHLQPETPRLKILEGVCSKTENKTLNFFVHKSPTCGSIYSRNSSMRVIMIYLLSGRRGAPPA